MKLLGFVLTVFLVGCPTAEPYELEPGEPTPRPDDDDHDHNDWDDYCEYPGGPPCECCWDDPNAPDAFDFNRMRFSFALEVDDSGEALDVTAVFETRLLMSEDPSSQEEELTCRQLVEVKGTGTLGRGTLPECPECTGVLEFDPDTAVDVSDPESDPEHCDPVFLADNIVSMGMALLQPFGSEPGFWPAYPEQGGRNFGDFLRIALMDRDAQAGLDFDGALNAFLALTVPDNDAYAAKMGHVYTHGGFIRAGVDDRTLGAESGLDSVAATPTDGGPWRYYLRIARDASAEPLAAGRMDGRYLGESPFMIHFGL